MTGINLLSLWEMRKELISLVEPHLHLIKNHGGTVKISKIIGEKYSVCFLRRTLDNLEAIKEAIEHVDGLDDVEIEKLIAYYCEAAAADFVNDNDWLSRLEAQYFMAKHITAEHKKMRNIARLQRLKDEQRLKKKQLLNNEQPHEEEQIPKQNNYDWGLFEDERNIPKARYASIPSATTARVGSAATMCEEAAL
jgi:hypothetical protein